MEMVTETKTKIPQLVHQESRLTNRKNRMVGNNKCRRDTKTETAYPLVTCYQVSSVPGGDCYRMTDEPSRSNEPLNAFLEIS